MWKLIPRLKTRLEISVWINKYIPKVALCSHWISYSNSTAFAFNCSRTAHCAIALVSEWPLILNNWNKLKNVPTEPSNWLLYGFSSKLLSALPHKIDGCDSLEWLLSCKLHREWIRPKTHMQRELWVCLSGCSILKAPLGPPWSNLPCPHIKGRNCTKENQYSSSWWLCIISAHGWIVPSHVKGQVNQELAWGEQ